MAKAAEHCFRPTSAAGRNGHSRKAAIARRTPVRRNRVKTVRPRLGHRAPREIVNETVPRTAGETVLRLRRRPSKHSERK